MELLVVSTCRYPPHHLEAMTGIMRAGDALAGSGPVDRLQLYTLSDTLGTGTGSTAWWRPHPTIGWRPRSPPPGGSPAEAAGGGPAHRLRSGLPVQPATRAPCGAVPGSILAPHILHASSPTCSASIPRVHPGRFRRLMLGFKGGMIRQERLDFPPFILTFTDVSGELGYEQVSI
jgi:hypothetical protein